MKDFLTIRDGIFRHEFVVEKSRFISFACRVSTVEQANFFIADVSKKHYDATHNCYAFVTAESRKFSDDGEPQGTAGLPILGAIQGKGLENVAVVVTRYFGGIKLGAGGLVRAYGKAAAEVLEEAEKVRVLACVAAEIKCDYSLVSAVEAVCRDKGKILSRDYGAEVVYRAAVPEKRVDAFVKQLSDMTQGRALCEFVDAIMTEF